MAEPIDLQFGLWTRGVLKEAQVQSYLPGGASVPSALSTLVPPRKYDRTTRLRRRCGLMSNYFEHLLLLLLVKQYQP